MAKAAQPKRPTPLPGATLSLALARALGRQLASEWAGNPIQLRALERPQATGFAASARDFRPIWKDRGERTLAGSIVMEGDALHSGIQGDPWNRPSPSRRYALELHRFAWAPDLVVTGEDGAREALRLVFLWDSTFGRWNAFSWSAEVLERRVFNLACTASAMAAATTEEEAPILAQILARNARGLLQLREPVGQRCSQLAAGAVAGAALSGMAGRKLLRAALPRLARALAADVLPDGGHVTRSPERGMELLFDLRTLDDVLQQRGLAAPAELSRAIDRLTAGLRFFTLPDGRLPCMQGGEASTAARVAAAMTHDDSQAAPATPRLPHAGYQRLSGRSLTVLVDAGAPARGALSLDACAQPGAMEVVCGGERLVSNAGWSPRLPGSQELRLTEAASTAMLGTASAGRPLKGLRARSLGPRLIDGAFNVEVARQEAATGDLLEFSHDGWAQEFGLTHARRLFLDTQSDALRGEDRFEPLTPPQTALVTYTIRFHLFPGASATLARDSQSVLLRAPTQGGWWLRNDAPEVRIESSVHNDRGRLAPTTQVLLRGHFRAEKGTRVRWKLTPAEF